MANWIGTPVPNTGYVEKVYLNTALSAEEVASIIESANLPFTDGDNYYLAYNNDNVKIRISIMSDGSNNYYTIYDNNNYFINTSAAGLGYVGWNPEFNGVIEVNSELVDTYTWSTTDSASVGTHNEALSSLFSTTPFEKEKTYRFKKLDNDVVEVEELPSLGTSVPNTGYVEKVYFNTNLSVDEVIQNLYSLAPYVTDNFIYLLSDNDKNLIYIRIEDFNTQAFGIYNMHDFTSSNDDLEILFLNNYTGSDPNYNFQGWNPNFNGVIEINGQVTDTFTNSTPNVGLGNELITDLFSTTSFDSNIDPNKIYKMKATGESKLYIHPGEEYGIVDLSQPGNLFGMTFLVELVDHVPDISEMKPADEATATMYIYYYRDNSTGYMSYDGTTVEEAPAGLIVEVNNVNEITVPGEIFYLVIGRSSDTYYRYNNGWVEVLDGLIDVEYKNGEPVKNTGYIENIYVNKSLSVEEVNKVIENANLSYYNGNYLIYLAVDDNNNVASMLNISSPNPEEGFVVYWNYQYVVYSSSEVVSTDLGLDFVGFNPAFDDADYIEVNSNVTNAVPEGDAQTIFGTTSGLQNSLLVDILSETPKFGESYTKRENLVATVNVPGKAIVPNTGYVEKIYVNTELSIDEVTSILQSAVNQGLPLTEAGEYYVYWSDTNKTCLVIDGNNGRINTADFTTYTVTTIWDATNGWVSFDNPIEVNSEVISDIDGTIGIGGWNNILTKLFSTTPSFTGKINKSLHGEFDGSSVSVSDNGIIDILAMLDEKKLPLEINVNVPIPEGYVKPTGTLEITENDVYNINTYAEADVNVSVLEPVIDEENNLFSLNGAEVVGNTLVLPYDTATVEDNVLVINP